MLSKPRNITVIAGNRSMRLPNQEVNADRLVRDSPVVEATSLSLRSPPPPESGWKPLLLKKEPGDSAAPLA